MSFSDHSSDVLLKLPWLPVSISGRHLLAKSWFGDAAYQILLTDMSCVWEERMDTAAIQRRAQELNKRMQAPVKAFFSHLCEVIQPTLTGSDRRPESEASVSLSQKDEEEEGGGGVCLRLKSKLSGLPFYWEFHCDPAPVTVVCVQLVRPLLAMNHLLQRQVDHLGSLLLRKDAEIQDYRENGATLTRERLQTEAFEEQSNREDFMAKTLPLLQNETLTFNPDLQQLYTAIVTHGNKRKRSEEPEQSPEEPSVTLDQGEFVSEAGDVKEQNGKQEAAKKLDPPPVKQSAPSSSDPAERPTSKPKKKKVGLFR